MSGACRPCQWTKAPSVPTAFCGPGVTYARFTEDTELQLGLTQAGSRWNLDYIPAQAVSWGARHKPGFGSRLCCSPAVWSWVSLGDFVLAPEMGKESSCFVASGVGSRGEPMWRNRLGEGCPVNSKQKSSLYSVQFSHSVTYDSLQPHGLQHARPPCPSPSPRVYSNSRALSR